jgi:hypothetical protein
MKFYIRVFFENLPKKFKFFIKNRTRIKCTLHESQYTFLIISRSVLPGIKTVSGKTLYRKSKHTLYVQQLFFSENRAVYNIFRKNCVERDRP